MQRRIIHLADKVFFLGHVDYIARKLHQLGDKPTPAFFGYLVYLIIKDCKLESQTQWDFDPWHTRDRPLDLISCQTWNNNWRRWVLQSAQNLLTLVCYYRGIVSRRRHGPSRWVLQLLMHSGLFTPRSLATLLQKIFYR